MATSIKSRLTEALSQHLNLDAIKRDFFKEKYQKEWYATQIPTTSRHKNTIEEVISAFEEEGVSESSMRWKEVSSYRRKGRELVISLDNMQLYIMDDKDKITLHNPFNYYELDITYKSLPDVAKRFIHISSLRSQLEEEWEELIASCSKRAKLRSMNETSIDAVLKDMIKGTDIQYRIKRQQYRVALTIVMKHNVQATFLIQHSKFREQLGKILPAIQQLNELMDEMGQPIKIKTVDKNEVWLTAN